MIAHKELQRAVLALRKLTDLEMDQEASITVHALRVHQPSARRRVLIESVSGGEKVRRERESRFGRPLPPKPVELGKEYDVDIQEISRQGQGIARIKGLVIFVPDTRPGDRVWIRITRISQRFAEADVVRKAAEGSATE